MGFEQSEQEVPDGIEFDNIQFMWKDRGSNVGHCPAISRVEGGYVLTGPTVGERTRAQVHAVSGVGEGEGVIFVPANVIDRIKDLP